MINDYTMVELTKEQIRKYMEEVVEVMRNSIAEVRADGKPTPKVGALIVKPDGSTETAYRGELREGDHAEYTLIERKCRDQNLTGAVLFATLEPCAPGARKSPKLSCAERITNARIAKVFYGIEDPDPTVSGKGCSLLKANGVEVALFDRDLQDEIRACNTEFLNAANERSLLAKEEPKKIMAAEGSLDAPVKNCTLEMLDAELVQDFLDKAGWNVKFGEKEGMQLLTQFGILVSDKNGYVPSGTGLLLFGKHPEASFPNAIIKATFINDDGSEGDIVNIAGPLVKQPDKAHDWYEQKIGKQIDRSHPERKPIYDYPLKVIREVLINAIIHRQYEVLGAPIYLTISNDEIVVKSPGYPVEPITLEQINNFSAPTISRNPRMMFVFGVLNLSEQRGLGFKTVRDLPEVYNFPLPVAKWETPYLSLVLSRKPEGLKEDDLTEKERKALDFIRLNGETPRKLVEEHLGLEKKTAERLMNSLLEKGKVEKKGVGRGTVYVAIVNKKK